MTRVIGYTRLSVARADESTSIERQRDHITRTCEARGYDLVGIVDDVGVSATRHRLDRPGLDEVRRAVHAGEADAVMVWRLDRIARSVGDFSTLLDEGLDIVSATEPLDTSTPMGRAMAEVLQVFAGMESRATGERIKSSVAHLRRAGRFAGGIPAYGYKSIPHPDGAGRALAPCPDEAPIARRIIEEVLAGKSTYAIARGLNLDGVPTRRGKEWSPTTVRRIAISDGLLGRSTHRGEVVRDEHGIPETHWEPIATLDEVERARAILAPTSRKAPARRRAARLLSGLMACSTCGSRMVVRRRPGGKPDVYACAAAARGMRCDRGMVVEAPRVEEIVEERFLSTLGVFRVVEEVTTTHEDPQVAAVEEAIQHTAAALTDPDADVEALVGKLTTLRQRREALALQAPEVETRMVDTGRSFRDAWEDEDTAGRRALLTSAGVEVVVHPAQRGAWDPDRIEVLWTNR